MPLTLDQYASHLDTRDIVWPVAPEADPPKARPHLPAMSNVRLVLFTVYGTLLRIFEGDMKFEHPNDFIMDVALDKTIHEFKMWNAMSRKPGQPAEYMKQIYKNVLNEQRLAPSPNEKFPEILSERIWENIIKKLFQKDYKFDAGFYGSLNEYSKKVAYFFHASLQGTACYPGAAATLRELHQRGIQLGLLADGQCFTTTQLQRGLQAQEADANLDLLIPARLRFLSHEFRARKPSERFFASALQKLREFGIEANDVLHVGSSLTRDIVPAKRVGFRTALFAGDRQSLVATAEQLKDPQSRPDALLTELAQLTTVLGEGN